MATDERRAAYRVKDGLEGIKVSMAPPSESYVATTLIDLSAKGAALAVAIPATQIAALPIGTSVVLRIDVPGVEPISDIPAVVRSMRGDDGNHVCGLEILDWRILHSRLPPRLFAAFNRRRHYRVSVPSKPETTVAVSTKSGRALTATLSDISEGGCSLLFPPEEVPDVGEGVQINFCLPDSGYRLDVQGSVRSASEFENSINCGIEFKDVQSREFLAHQHQISLYVTHRQRELRSGKKQPTPRSSTTTTEVYSYSIDGSDIIAAVNEAWLRFALANGAPELNRAVIGKSLWDFVSDPETRAFYRTMFQRVRSERVQVTIPFRCDSPTLRRYMELKVRSGPKGRLEISGRILRQERHDHVPLLGHPERSFLMCSLCKRVNASGDWIAPEVAPQRFRIFETTDYPQIKHGICADCSRLAKRVA